MKPGSSVHAFIHIRLLDVDMTIEVNDGKPIVIGTECDILGCLHPVVKHDCGLLFSSS